MTLSLDDLQRALNAMLSDGPPLKLTFYAPPCEYSMGEDWVRRRYGFSGDIGIEESKPLPTDKPDVR